MDLPATDDPVTTGGEAEWLIDADDPLLTDEALIRVADPSRPDRLAWNAFRTLALWDTDSWIPAFLEVACGADNRLSPLDWGGAAVTPFAAGVKDGRLCDVVLDGPEAYVVVACTLLPDPPETELRAAAIAALDGSLHGGREAGFVVVAPPGADDIEGRLDRATDVELLDGRLVYDLLTGAMGWADWPYLGRLALDLAEEGDPDVTPVEQVRHLVGDLQARFPGAEI